VTSPSKPSPALGHYHDMATWRPLPGHATALAAALLSAGCATGVPDRSARPSEPLTWAAYLQAEDLRSACAAKKLDHFRLVMNPPAPGARVRVYDVVGQPDGSALVEGRFMGVGSLSEIKPSDRLAAWDGRLDRMVLDPRAYAQVRARLSWTGAFTGSEGRFDMSGSRLSWIAGGCHGGSFFRSAFAFPPGMVDEVALRPR